MNEIFRNNSASGICCLLVLCLMACASATPSSDVAQVAETTGSVIVQGPNAETAKRLVLEVGGTVTHELAIIRAVAAQLTATQLDRLTGLAPELKIYGDRAVETSGRGNTKNGGTDILNDDSGSDPYTGSEWIWEPTVQTTPAAMLEADVLHQEGITGFGVTVAVIDTGLHDFAKVMYRDGQPRVLGQYDVTRKKVWKNPLRHSDGNGHGGHVNGLIVNREVHRPTGTFYGLAPGADLVVVKAFDDQGQGTYSDVIAGIDWIVNN
ncbi:MAG: S8 family serine peptidase, partial [Thermoanaerobaculia bacterium]